MEVFKLLSLTFILLIRANCFLVMSGAPRKVTKILTVNNGAGYGNWGPAEFCAAGSYAIGFDMKFQSYQGAWHDASGLNAIQLHCATVDGKAYGGYPDSYEGNHGSWLGVTACHDHGHDQDYLTAFKLQVEPFQSIWWWGTISDPYGIGSWGPAEFFAAGSYAIGFDMKFQSYQGAWHDDSGLNAIQLHCATVDGKTYGGYPDSYEGHHGSWLGVTECHDHGHNEDYLTAFQLQVESFQGHFTENSAATWIKFRCRDLNARKPEYEITKSPGHWDYGSYGSWSASCGAYSAICGISTKVEPETSDNSGVNDVKFYCCIE